MNFRMFIMKNKIAIQVNYVSKRKRNFTRKDVPYLKATLERVC